jgi:hypothetical protein
MYANVWATGRLTVSRWPGGMCIAEGQEKALRKHFQTVCRHAYKRGVLLVPGIPEAPNQTEGLKALKRFVDWTTGYRGKVMRAVPNGVRYRPRKDWDAGDAKGPGSKGRAS